MSEVADLAQHKWNSILPQFGVDRSYLKNRGGPCIICGGKDRARFDNKLGRGTFYCNECGPYDGFKVIERLTNKPFKEVAVAVEKLVGVLQPDPPKREPDERQYHQWMAEVWRGSEPIGFGDPVDLWLNHRLRGYTLDMIGQSALRYHPALAFRREGAVIGEFPAMLARVEGPDGKNRQLHRTYLTMDGQKAMDGESRSLMAGRCPAGAYVPLMAHTDQVLGIAEGIETALAAAQRFKVPVHAALNAHNLQAWTPPATVQHVMVFGDNDASMTGQAAAYALAKRLVHEQSKGKLKCTVEVLIPNEPGYDWNKVWNPTL